MDEFITWCKVQVDKGSMAGFVIILFVVTPSIAAFFLATLFIAMSGKFILATIFFSAPPIAFIVAKYRSRHDL